MSEEHEDVEIVEITEYWENPKWRGLDIRGWPVKLVPREELEEMYPLGDSGDWQDEAYEVLTEHPTDLEDG